MGIAKLLSAAFLAIASSMSSAVAQEVEPARIQISMAGSVSAQGADNPFTLLNDPAIQGLLRAAAERPLTLAEVETALANAEIEATPENLVRVGAFRREGDRFFIAFNLLTVADLAHLLPANEPFANSLADAIMAHSDEYAEIFARYDLAGVDIGDLRYFVIGCIGLDWDGLDYTREAEYRGVAPTHPNGGTYTLNGRQGSESIDWRGYYWGSHNHWPGSYALTTFGDHHSPRPNGFPDAVNRFWSIIRSGNNRSDDARLLARVLSPDLDEIYGEVAQVMLAMRGGPRTVAGLSAVTGIDTEALNRLLALLESLDYVAALNGNSYRANIVVLDDRDQDMVDQAKALTRRIVAEWLEQNYDAYRAMTANLTPARNRVPHSYAFTEYWHFIFGGANKILVERGFFSDQYAPARTWQGYSPAVWVRSLSDFQGA